MRLTVVGATGATGRQLVRQALDAGHDVVAVARRPEAVTETHPRLDVVGADVMDGAAVAPAVEGSDVVLSAIGPRGARSPTTVCTDGARSLVDAMRATGVQRLLVVSAAGLATEGDGPFTRLVVKPILGRVLRHPFADLHAMERTVRDSGLDWTVVRPPRLTDGEHSGRYETARDRNVRGGFRVSRADLADCMLNLAVDADAVRHVVSVAS